jgi:antitoxin VapB
MRKTRLFKNGNSQAVRIPAEFAYERTDMMLEIERVGDELRIRPARKSLKGVLKKFARFPPDFMANGRNQQEQAEREEL